MSLIPVRREGRLFVDALGRQVTLRGVNLGGDCKIPYPNAGIQVRGDFSDHRDVSFIGRPFPLEEVDEHFGRLRHWGFNVLRLLTTWEAVEHAGPGRYDEAYLDYLEQVCRRAGDFGLHLFVDFHQDVWSRMSGGDGAPGWCFGAVGLDFTKFDAADAAHVMQHRFDPSDPNPRQAAYPQMSWPTNYRLPANGVMWSLFWAGRVLTPDFLIDGRNVQDLLQDSYLGSMEQVARRLSDLPNVLGFDTLNEPGVGYLGEAMSVRQGLGHGLPGLSLSPLDALAVARGVPTTVAVLRRRHGDGVLEVAEQRTLNAKGVSIWRDGAECPFERAGAYDFAGGVARPRREDFFQRPDGRVFEISHDGYGPFFRRVADTVRRHNPGWALFAELDPFGGSAGRRFPQPMPQNAVNGTHWYDRAILFRKTFEPDRGDGAADDCDPLAETRARFIRELAQRAAHAADFPDGAPSLIGEFGIPFDLDDGAAFKAWAGGARGDEVWAPHIQALSLMYDALDELQLHATQWNYTASNRNDLRVGDGWNQEDLSIFSRDQQDDPERPDSGGRAIRGFCRPYATAIQGRLVSSRFNMAAGRFELEFDADPAIAGPTLVYVPAVQFPAGRHILLAGPARSEWDQEGFFVITAMGSGRVRLLITDEPAAADR
ncbi:MAG TPA: cellulase family glycosylhydrolase [Caulobacteraceae bacterium]